MCPVRKPNKNVVAILSADWHLTLRPPAWRSAEPDWYTAMMRPLDELHGLQAEHSCPILHAGDITDKWNAPIELPNWIAEVIPKNVYSIVGQHDLPHHRRADIKKSAYHNLELTDSITTIYKDGLHLLPGMTVWGFPFGVDIQRAPTDKYKGLKIALVHDYVWFKDKKHPKAPKNKEIRLCRYPVPHKNIIDCRYYGYDVIVYGDNHKGFMTQIGKTTIFNCGTLMRRKSDEVDYKPQVGLLYSDGSVEPYYLDISQDKHLDAATAKKKEQEEEEFDMVKFAKELMKLGDSALDFSEAMKRYCRTKKIKAEVHQVIRTAMEGEQ